MEQFWDKRYDRAEYVYGKEPNDYFREKLEGLKPGDIVLPGEGEGRNAVYAAANNWSVTAFDTSREGRKKAIALATESDVRIKYHIAPYLGFSYKSAHFDAAGLFFTHQPAEMRKKFHREIINTLKPGGHLILEAFHKEQINRDTGGPGNLEMLFNEEELEQDFKELKILEMEKVMRHLSEGIFHQGEAVVIRLFGQKS